MTLFAMERTKMIGLMLFLILVSCESKPTEEQLVRECQNRNGVPNLQGGFKCEMPQDQTQVSQGKKPLLRKD
jgi:hypothetical protein